jgi:hypothetical protein
MLSSTGLTTVQIIDAFTEEIGSRGGRVTDTFDDGRRLFMRSVFPESLEVRPGDKVQGGIALKASEAGVWLYPYIFRLVCTNGAIAAQTLESQSIEELDMCEPDIVIQLVREGIEACTAEAFSRNVAKMRASTNVEADLALNLLSLMSRFPAPRNVELMQQVMDRFTHDGDKSRFGLANAITSLARDTRAPALRWDLEEFGGGIAMGTNSQHHASGCGSAKKRSSDLVAVG